MADVTKLRLGSISPQSLLRNNIFNKDDYQYPYLYFGTLVPKDNTKVWASVLGEWQVNDDWDIEIINPYTIAIKKFRIDTWGIRKIWNKGNVTDTDPIGHDFMKGLRIKVTGLTYVHENVVYQEDSEGNKTYGFVPAYCGTSGYNVYWYPGQFTSGNYIKGLGVQNSIGYQANANEIEDSFIMGKHPWDVGSRNAYTDGIYGGTWGDGGYRATSIGLFGGYQTALKWHEYTTEGYNGNAYKVYDISDTPIIISINLLKAASKITADLSNVEIWNIYSGSDLIYKKEKTVENCWIKHNIAVKDENGIITVIKTGADNIYSGMNMYLPPVIDLADNIQNLRFNVKLANTDYWDEIKAAIAATPITDYEFLPNVFKNSNVTGSIEMTLDLESGSDLSWGTTHKWNHWGNATEVTLKVAEGSGNRITAPQHLFYGANKLVTINTPENIMSGRDTSGMFEGCASLVNIPNNLIYWADRSWSYEYNVSGNNVCYMCSGCYSLVTFPSYNTEDRYANDNTIVSHGHIRQAFQACSKLESIGPVIDLKYVDPQTSAQNAFLFLGTPKLTDVRIKNLNHGTWHFDDSAPSNEDDDLYGYQGNIPLLDSDSIVYLFDNLTDLNTHEEGSTDIANPNRTSARIYCPSEWEDKITNEMIAAANTKGWSIYIGGTLKTV